MPKNNVIETVMRETTNLLENWVFMAGLVLLALREAFPQPNARKFLS